MDTTQKGLLTLLKSAVTGEKLTLPEGFSLQEACRTAKKQNLIPLVYQGAVNCGLPGSDPVMQQLFQASCRYLLRSEHQMATVERIFRGLEENGIPYMPVKGCNMKTLYPKPELRPMGDADILIHPEDHDRIRPVMEQAGLAYRIEDDHTFVWHSPVLHVELHKSLVPPSDEDYIGYYGTGWQLAKKGEGCRYDLSPEDTYLFLFTHLARHYRGGGIGCRHVLDLYVYRRAYPRLDDNYIEGELRKLQLTRFHENILQLLEVWFGAGEENEVTRVITDFLFSGGSWGTVKNQTLADEVKNARKAGKVKNSGAKAFLRALFPPLGYMTYTYEVLRRHPYLLPLMWVVRWFHILLRSPGKIRRKLPILKSVDDAGIRAYQQALELVGLDFRFGKPEEK